MTTVLTVLAVPLFLSYVIAGIVMIDDVININKRSR